MDDVLLYAEVERLDAEMASTPLTLRPLDIYNVLIGKEDRDEESQAYLNKITAWFVQRYGDEAVWDGVLSRDPIFFRGRVHLLEIIHNGVSERRGLDTFLKRLEDEGKPPSLEEWKYLSRTALESSQDFSSLHNLEMTPSLLSIVQRDLCRRAWFDLRNVGLLLQSSGDVQGAIVHAHEAAEKFLKVALLHLGLAPDQLGKGKYRHNLEHLLDALIGRQNKYSFLRKPAKELHGLLASMNARYSSLKRSLKDAVEAFRLARHCCSFVAQQVLLDKIRGAPDIALQEGRYYQDYAGRKFRFCGTVKDDGEQLALMYLLGAKDRGQTIDALARFQLPCSFHYTPIDDQHDLRRLESRYQGIMDQQRKNPVMRPDPQTTVEVDKESLDAMVLIRTPVKTGRS
jgi:HEPN domain-containing protein